MDDLEVIGPSSVPLPGSDLFVPGALLVLALVAVFLTILLATRRWMRTRRQMPTGRPTGLVIVAIFAAAFTTATVATWPRGFFVPEFPPLPALFPEDAFFYRPVLDLPVTPDSEQTLSAIGDLQIVAATSSQEVDGRTGGIAFNLVEPDTPRKRFSFTYPSASDGVAYPITDPAYVQSMPFYRHDNHYVGIDLEAGKMWELASIRRWFWIWQAGSGAEWDLGSLEYPRGLSTASGLPLLPLSFTFDEVEAGSIDHALAVSLPNVRAHDYQWPARSTDGPVSDPDAPAMGTWFRLRDDVDLSGLGPQARVIAEALKEYGAVLHDTGGAFALSAVTDARWDDDDLRTLRSLTVEDLEVVDASELMVEPNSMAASP